MFTFCLLFLHFLFVNIQIKKYSYNSEIVENVENFEFVHFLVDIKRKKVVLDPLDYLI